VWRSNFLKIKLKTDRLPLNLKQDDKLKQNKEYEMKKISHDFGNAILYDMCEKNPLHIDSAVVRAKISIIGKVYSASIERGVTKKEGDASVATKVALAVVKKGNFLDGKIRVLRELENVTPENIHFLFEAHAYLNSIFYNVTSMNKPSLASKYLHFHAPRVVFIYDSLASKAIEIKTKEKAKKQIRIWSKIIKSKINFKELKIDADYFNFCLKCLYYSQNKKFLPRALDKKLLKQP
jgi:hypothetical protein